MSSNKTPGSSPVAAAAAAAAVAAAAANRNHQNEQVVEPTSSKQHDKHHHQHYLPSILRIKHRREHHRLDSQQESANTAAPAATQTEQHKHHPTRANAGGKSNGHKKHHEGSAPGGHVGDLASSPSKDVVQQLYYAERETKKIVDAARARRADNVQRARSQALKEIQELESSLDEQFKRSCQSYTEEKTQFAVSYQLDVERQLAEIERMSQSNRQAIIDMLSNEPDASTK